MMHKAWRTIEEVPYCFVRSFIKFQGHTGWKIDDNLIWVRCRCQANTWTMTVMTSPVFFHWIILTHWGQTNHNKANLRDLIAATGLVISNWIQIIDFFPLKFDGWPRKTIGTSSILCQALCIISIPSGEFENWNWSYSLETLNSDWNWRYFVLCYLEIRWMTLENIRAHLLYYIKLCVSFQIHRWNQSCVTVRKLLIRVNIDFFCPVWPWNSMNDIEKQKGTSSTLH